jgi:serine-type D-Ala-D-Ala carboxypeptidase (penicillin-binding protein 5/6)
LQISIDNQPYIEQPLFALKEVEQSGWLGRSWDALRLWIK